MKIIVGDQVKVIVGKDQGKIGKVVRVLPKRNLIYVEGVGRTVRHVKPNVNKSGERKDIFKPINVCKVAVLNSQGEIDRIGYRVDKDGTKTRFFKKTGADMTAQSPKVATKGKTKTKVAKPKKAKTSK